MLQDVIIYYNQHRSDRMYTSSVPELTMYVVFILFAMHSVLQILVYNWNYKYPSENFFS